MKLSLPIEGDFTRVILGAFSASHLGDILCMSPLPRLLKQHRGIDIHVSNQPHMRDVFANNPFVAGFAADFTVLPGSSATGDGHVLQRLLQGFELPLDPRPKPEIYLDAHELAWARIERDKWPTSRPVCLLSTAAVSDNWNLDQVAWEEVVKIISETHTVVQPVRMEGVIDGALPCRNLTVRQYMSLFSVTDLFVGATSGGSHVAAALDIPSIIVIWQSLEKALQFPTSGHGFKASFLYAQHWFISAEDISNELFDHPKFEKLLKDVLDHGSKGRPVAFGKHPVDKFGFLPRCPVRIDTTRPGRFIRFPTVYPE